VKTDERGIVVSLCRKLRIQGANEDVDHPKGINQ
jgi:hypothetical protein